MKKIIVVIPNGGGGAEKVSSIYAKIFSRCNATVKVVLIDKVGKNGPIKDYIPENIPIIRVECNHGYSSFFRLYKILKLEKPDYVFCSLTILSAILVICSFLIPHIKVITRQCFTPGTESFVVEKIIAVLFPKAFVNIAQTEEMRLSMIDKYHLPSDKVITINNPIDEDDINNKISDFIPADIQKYSYISIGRIHPQKDFATLIKAFSEVKAQHDSAILTIVGAVADKSYYEYLNQLISNLELQDSVTFIDYTHNPYKHILSHKCFVLSSITEGLPNVLLEAMYLLKPVVATCCIPFISQIINDGINGYKVEQIGDCHNLAKKMIKAVELNNICNINHNERIISQIQQLIC